MLYHAYDFINAAEYDMNLNMTGNILTIIKLNKLDIYMNTKNKGWKISRKLINNKYKYLFRHEKSNKITIIDTYDNIQKRITINDNNIIFEEFINSRKTNRINFEYTISNDIVNIYEKPLLKENFNETTIKKLLIYAS
jgi:hypothetical protein